MVGGGVGVSRRDDVVGILDVALLVGGSRIVALSPLRLWLVVLIGVLVEGGLVVAVGGGGVSGCSSTRGAESKERAVESLQRLAVVVATVVRHCNSIEVAELTGLLNKEEGPVVGRGDNAEMQGYFVRRRVRLRSGRARSAMAGQ